MKGHVKILSDDKFAGLTYEEMLVVADGYRCPKCGLNSVYALNIYIEEHE